jgi:hypothetical protein
MAELMSLLAAALREKEMANTDVEGLMAASPDYLPDGDGIEFVGGGPWDGKKVAPACVPPCFDVLIPPPNVQIDLHDGCDYDVAKMAARCVHRYLRAKRPDGRYVMEYVGKAER